MSSLCRNPDRLLPAIAAVALWSAISMAGAAAAEGEPLRVCADPNNLPFSNEREQGFENALAEFVARETGRNGVEYAWRPQRRGFVRNTLKAGRCDVIMSVPADYELARPTHPYYRSSYVWVYREDAPFELQSLDDPRLEALRIGVHMVGDDYSNTPGAAALGRRGLINNIVGYSIYGDYSEPHPPARLIEGVAAGDVDAAIAWGPLAGYFATRQAVPLQIAPVKPQLDAHYIPFSFDIAMATRRDDDALHAQLDALIDSRGEEIRALLSRYGVPVADPTSPRDLEKFP